MKTPTNRGGALEAAVRKKGYPVSHLAERLGVSRSTLYQYFKKEDLDIETVDRAAKVIGWDYVREFKGLSEDVYSIVTEPAAGFSALSLCREELGKIQAHLTATQQKLINAYETIESYQRVYGPLPN